MLEVGPLFALERRDPYQDCTPPPTDDLLLSLDNSSLRFLRKYDDPDQGLITPKTWSDADRMETEIIDAASEQSKRATFAVSPGQAAPLGPYPRSPPIAEVIDVDALNDGDNVWDNGDDEAGEPEGEDEPPEAYDDDDDDLCEEVELPKRGGRCLGEIVVNEAETRSECPVCGIVTLHWGQEEKARHVNKCLDSSDSKSAPSSTIKASGMSKPLGPLSSFQHRHTTPFARQPPNAFSLLMSSRKENEAWKAAEVDLAKHDSVVGKARRAEGGRRKAPFYKVMQGMPIAVDAFRYGKIPGVTAYLLTHAHSDHYTNLSSSWKAGPIYCSPTTANLIKLMLNVDDKWIKPLPFDTPTILPNTGGVEVTLLEANHCPGSCLFLFTGRQTINAGDCDFPSPHVGSTKLFRYLHCGDFRASPRHVLHPSIKGKRLDLVYLDTTYLNAKYCFPPQKQVIEACAALAGRLVLKAETPTDDASSAKGSVQDWLKRANVKDESSDVEATKLAVKDEWDDAEMLALDDSDDPSGVPLTTAESRDDEKPDPRIFKDEDALDTSLKGKGKKKERPLVVIGTYSIGKERIVKAVARMLSSQIYCDARKRKILLCQEDPELHSLLTDNPHAAQVHLVPLGTINIEKLEPYYSKYRNFFSHVIGFRPTGWTYSAPSGTDLVPNISNLITRSRSRNFTAASLNLMRNSNSQYQLYGVPYSEHSSFFELTAFALSINVGKIIATVNVGTAKSRGMMSKWFEKWDVERKKRVKEKKEAILPYRSLDYW
ncbi:hypothetical protein FRB93_006392 [Tulasnella sp. JGI-2019a]|nr:hypothetical protein FRB93_006392 [Tulasnella sp. JGI-2019a]